MPHSAFVGFMSVAIARWLPIRRSTVLMALAFVGFGVLYSLYPPSTADTNTVTTNPNGVIPGLVPATTTTTRPSTTTTTKAAASTSSTTTPAGSSTSKPTTTTTSTTTSSPTTSTTTTTGTSSTTTTSQAKGSGIPSTTNANSTGT